MTLKGEGYSIKAKIPLPENDQIQLHQNYNPLLKNG